MILHLPKIKHYFWLCKWSRHTKENPHFRHFTLNDSKKSELHADVWFRKSKWPTQKIHLSVYTTQLWMRSDLRFVGFWFWTHPFVFHTAIECCNLFLIALIMAGSFRHKYYGMNDQYYPLKWFPKGSSSPVVTIITICSIIKMHYWGYSARK